MVLKDVKENESKKGCKKSLRGRRRATCGAAAPDRQLPLFREVQDLRYEQSDRSAAVSITAVPLKYTAIVVCAAATFAAIQEGHLIRTEREQQPGLRGAGIGRKSGP